MNDLTKPFKRLPVALIGTGSYVPETRLTNRGLVDCRTFEFIDLVVK